MVKINILFSYSGNFKNDRYPCRISRFKPEPSRPEPSKPELHPRCSSSFCGAFFRFGYKNYSPKVAILLTSTS
jgi:hypothetical protein